MGKVKTGQMEDPIEQNVITHVVMWRLKAGSPPSAPDELKEKLEAMSGRIPGLLSVEAGIDVRRRDNSADLVLITRFGDADALDRYHSHPAHREVVAFAAQVQEFSLVVDY